MFVTLSDVAPLGALALGVLALPVVPLVGTLVPLTAMMAGSLAIRLAAASGTLLPSAVLTISFQSGTGLKSHVHTCETLAAPVLLYVLHVLHPGDVRKGGDASDARAPSGDAETLCFSLSSATGEPVPVRCAWGLAFRLLEQMQPHLHRLLAQA